MKSVVLDFVSFKTSSTREASYKFMLDVIKTWNLRKLVHSITMETDTHIFKEVELLRIHL